MTTRKQWQVGITLIEEDGQTRAEAQLHPDKVGAAYPMTAQGVARCNPEDVNVPEIGDEIAVSRALSELAHHLLGVAAKEISSRTHQPAHLTH